MTEAKHPEVIYINPENNSFLDSKFWCLPNIPYILKSKYDERINELEHENTDLGMGIYKLKKELKELKEMVTINGNQIEIKQGRVTQSLNKGEVCTCNNQSTDVYCNCK